MKPACRHFGDCGGCSFQDVPYPEQLEIKRKRLAAIAGTDDIDMIASPEIYGFRNKMEYSFETGNLGLHPRSRYDTVVDVRECPVFSGWVGNFLEDVREFARRHQVSFYSRREKRGALRYLVIRECKFTGEKMVILVTDGHSFTHRDEFRQMAEDRYPEIVSIYIARMHRTGDTAFTDDFESIGRKEPIRMKIGDKLMEIGPYSFVQPNSYQIKNMYEWIGKRVEGECSILDLFSGIGAISFHLADRGRTITAVDSSESCIEDGLRASRDLRPEGNIIFSREKVRDFLSGSSGDYDYVIIDPPRGGMSYRIWKHLNRLSSEAGTVKKIIYVSCSLKNLEQDLGYIRENTNWRISGVAGVDQFVHTPHLESLIEIDTENG